MPNGIPAGVKRTLRQEAGFGCARCGLPIFEYHHIVPRAEEEHNRPVDMVILCPNHHDECTKGAATEAEQRAWKSRPFNIVRGYAEGLLKVNQSYCAVACGSCLMVNDGTQVRIDDEPLLGLSLEDGHVQISLTLYDENDDILALIQENEWLSGDAAVWDLEASYQRLTIRREPRDIRLRLRVGADPMSLEAQLWRNGHVVEVRPQGIFVNSKEARAEGVPGSSFAGLCFVAMSLEIDAREPSYKLVPDDRYGKSFIVSRESRLEALVEGVNTLSRLRAERGSTGRPPPESPAAS
jgi:hypothetical protein